MGRNKWLAHHSCHHAAVQHWLYCITTVLLCSIYHVVLALLEQHAFIVLYLVFVQYILSSDYLAPHCCQVSIIYLRRMKSAILFYYLLVYSQNDNKAL